MSRDRARLLDSALRVRTLADLDEIEPDRWDDLLTRGATPTVFLTREWLGSWWRALGRGRLLPIVGERGGDPVVMAPLFVEGGMGFFVGSGGSDYLDLVGDPTDEEALVAILGAARESIPGFVGFRFHHVPDASPTGPALGGAAARLGLRCFDEGALAAPAFDLAGAEAAAGKKSLVRHERWFRREGDLRVTHLRDGSEILPHLEDLFEQHVDRWAATDSPSLFLDEGQRDLYREVCRRAATAGWLRFTRLDWEGEPVAFHFGFSFAGTYLWYKPSFAVAHARRSPGEVLLRQLILAAADEGARVFDLGVGDEPFKRRFATSVPTVRTWGLYPEEVL